MLVETTSSRVPSSRQPAENPCLHAPGSTGQSLLTVLSQHPDKEIHAYCRSKSKLSRLSPDIARNRKRQNLQRPPNRRLHLGHQSSLHGRRNIRQHTHPAAESHKTSRKSLSQPWKIYAPNARLPRLIGRAEQRQLGSSSLSRHTQGCTLGADHRGVVRLRRSQGCGKVSA